MKYQNITHDDLLNGSGIRVVLWVSGCNHHCEGCHNPVTWDINDGLEFTNKEKEEIFTELNKDYISGITFSGGDPLHPDNRLEVLELISEIKSKFPNKSIWLYTGYLFEDILKWNLDISNIDVIVDGEFKKELFSPKQPWVGSSNQKVINVKESLKTNSIVTFK